MPDLRRKSNTPAAKPGRSQGRRSPPTFRRLQTFTFDPSLDRDMAAAVVNQTTLKVPWEDDLAPGPVGEYLEVIDHDPASDAFYEPVDLNDPDLLARDGLAPSDGDPMFHQQMAYAVAMTTIRNFESALGRPALWSPQAVDDKTSKDQLYVQRLRIHPHAMREANAYYSPEKKALLFGYFPASRSAGSDSFPAGMVFTCLSHDVVAHETTHALLDGMHRRFVEPSNPDVLAFHEALADIVALFQHFSNPDVLRHQIARTRGDLAEENLLGQLAVEVGQAIGQHGALRDAIGSVDPVTNQWHRRVPDPTALDEALEPHARGAILVAAIFDAFLSIYHSRVADLMRLASNGSGILGAGAIHPDLVNRLADEAAKSSGHVLNMCVRALDYCPCVDLTFGEYLRALITADYDLVRDDDRGYRTAVIESFRRRGIFPSDVRTLSVESLRWRGPENPDTQDFVEHFFGRHPHSDEVSEALRTLFRQSRVGGNREAFFHGSRDVARLLHEALEEGPLKSNAFFAGFDATEKVEVYAVRPSRRVGPDGNVRSELVVEITQERREFVDEQSRIANDGYHRDLDGRQWDFKFRGGCTLVIDLDEQVVRYNIVKRMNSASRLARQRAFVLNDNSRSLRATYFGSDQAAEPFAALHRDF